MSDQLSSFTTAQLRHAANLKEKIEALNMELGSILGTSAPVSIQKPKKGKMSAAGRARIAAAQRARWAKVKGAKLSTKPAAKTPTKRSGLSAAARAKLSAIAKARWAKAKRTGKTSL
jgi:hypothetical protein